MTYLCKPPSRAAISVLALLAGMSLAKAGEPVTVFTDHSRILEVTRPPGTIIVGNPSIADVTIQGTQVFLHARSYGTTNIIIMDEAGDYLADYDVTVQTGGDDNVVVFRSSFSQQTLLCAPDCEATLHVGDDPGYFKSVASQQQKKIGIALGQKDGENVSPQGQAAPAPE
jgi:Pilus formation protein N terminal region